MKGGTARCIGGPFDGTTPEAIVDEFTIESITGELEGLTNSGVYRYDRAANVYRWEPSGDPPLRVDGAQFEDEGDAAVYEGDMRSAKAKYGWAIDAYLDAGEFETAARTCRKLIRVAPDVARARFTLAFLLIGLAQPEEACRQLVSYAAVVRETDAAAFAIPRLQLLAHTTDDPPTRELIEALISELGGAVVPSAPRSSDFGAMARWERVLGTVLRDPPP